MTENTAESEPRTERDEQTVAESLQAIEKECEIDEKCRQTAVTYVDGEPACDLCEHIYLA